MDSEDETYRRYHAGRFESEPIKVARGSDPKQSPQPGETRAADVLADDNSFAGKLRARRKKVEQDVDKY